MTASYGQGMMNKLLFSLAISGLVLTACAKLPVVEPLSDAQLQSMSCKQIGRETDRLNLMVNQVRGNDALFGPEEQEKRASISAAESRLQQLRAQSVRKLCVFG